MGYEGSVPSFPPQISRPISQSLCSIPPGLAVTSPYEFPTIGMQNMGMGMNDDDFGMGEADDGDASRRFRCEICNTAFRFQGHLDRHMREELFKFFPWVTL